MNKKLLIVELILLFFIILATTCLGQIILRQAPVNHGYLIYLLLMVSVFALTFLFFRYNWFVYQKETRKNNDLQQQCHEQLNKTYEGTLKALICALDYRDHETWGHSARVASYATAIANQLGLKQEDLRILTWAGFLHDIGKIGVPDDILLKKAKLLPEEWAAIKRHPELGYEIVNQVDFLKSAARIILCHHEHFDGNGYPQGLKGKKIPLTARIFAIADALDAMTSDRPYRQARTMEEALHEVLSLSGRQFCPKCTQALAALGINKLHQLQLNVRENGDVKILNKSLETMS